MFMKKVKENLTNISIHITVEWRVEPHNISFPCAFDFMIVTIGLVFQLDITSALLHGMVV